MAFTITRYRGSNPGLNTRGFDITAANGDTDSTAQAHNCLWTPDAWSLESTDGTTCLYTGMWRAVVNATSFRIYKEAGAGAGAVRLTLERTATRP